MTVTKVTMAALIHSSVHLPSSYSAPTMLQVGKVTLTAPALMELTPPGEDG